MTMRASPPRCCHPFYVIETLVCIYLLGGVSSAQVVGNRGHEALSTAFLEATKAEMDKGEYEPEVPQ